MNGENGEIYERILICHWRVYSMAKFCWITFQCHVSNQCNALSEDSSLRKVFSGAIGSRVVNQSTDHRAGLNHQFLLCPSSHTCTHRHKHRHTDTHTDTKTLSQTNTNIPRHRDTHINTDIWQMRPMQLLRTFTFISAFKNWRWHQKTVESMVFVKHSETQSKGVAAALQGLVLAKRVNICKSLTTVS